MAIKTTTFIIESLGQGQFRTRERNEMVVWQRYVFTDATRPTPTEKTFPAGFGIWNTDDAAYNYSGGDLGVWYNALGVIT
jgi:hypothetical protein